MHLRATLAIWAALAMAPAGDGLAQGKAEVASFRVGGVGMEMPVPAGYCLPRGREADVAQLIAAVDKDNVTHLTLFGCPGDWKTNYVLLKTPTNILIADMSREEALKGLGQAFENPEFKALFSSGKVMSEAGKGVSQVLGRTVDLAGEIKPLGRDQACAYLGGISEVKSTDLSYRVAVGGCLTVVGRRFVSIFVYGPDKGPEGVRALLVRARQLMETIRIAPAA